MEIVLYDKTMMQKQWFLYDTLQSIDINFSQLSSNKYFIRILVDSIFISIKKSWLIKIISIFV